MSAEDNSHVLLTGGEEFPSRECEERRIALPISPCESPADDGQGCVGGRFQSVLFEAEARSKAFERGELNSDRALRLLASVPS